MDLMMSPPPPHQISGGHSSPEFEFWVTRNPSLPPSHLLSADELFAGGVMLPLHLLHHSEPDPPATEAPRPGENEETNADLSPAITSSAPVSASKRWKDIFRGISGEKKSAAAVEEKAPAAAVAAVSVEKSRRRERKMSAGGAAELNINIWPFSRSRSAGNSAGGGFRHKPSSSASAGRKVSSAPCSRSNSRGETSRPAAPGAGSRKCPSSPGRTRLDGAGGVYVGRSSNVSHIKRGTKKVLEAVEVVAGEKKGHLSGGGLDLNANTCIDHRQGQGNCRGENKEGADGGGRTVPVGGGGGGDGKHHHHFNLRALFSKSTTWVI